MLQFKKRMRAKIAALLFGLSAVLAGCSESEGDQAPSSQNIGTAVTSQNDGTEGRGSVPQNGSAGKGEPASQNDGADEAEMAVKRVSLTELPQYVFQTGDGHLLLLGEEVSLMNVNTLEITQHREDAGLDFSFEDFHSCKAVMTKDGYLVLGNHSQMQELGNGMFASGEAPRLMMVRFSKEGNVLEALNVGEVMGAKREIDNYGFVDNGRKLFCASMAEVFLYDLETGTRTEYPLHEGELRGIIAFGCMASKEKILFVANRDDGSRNYQRVLGSLRLDGTDLQYEKKGTREWGEIWGFDDFALIEDGKFHENGEKGSAFYYGADGKVREYALADEYTAIHPSETGKYFAVQSVEWMADGNRDGYTVRVYESESGRLMREIPCPFSEIGQNTMLWECLVSEEADAVFLLTCDWETKGNVQLTRVKL